MEGNQLCPLEVQTFLDSLQPKEMFTVKFIKQNGDVAEYMGNLDGSDNRKESVAIFTIEGWKRFSVNRVIEIERV